MQTDFRLKIEQLDRKLCLSNIIVAVVDSGIDYNHNYLKDNIWINAYKKVDGIDNDANGYIDDIRGWALSWNFCGWCDKECRQ